MNTIQHNGIVHTVPMAMREMTQTLSASLVPMSAIAKATVGIAPVLQSFNRVAAQQMQLANSKSKSCGDAS